MSKIILFLVLLSTGLTFASESPEEHALRTLTMEVKQDEKIQTIVSGIASLHQTQCQLEKTEIINYESQKFFTTLSCSPDGEIKKIQINGTVLGALIFGPIKGIQIDSITLHRAEL